MGDRGQLLQQVIRETGTTQTQLARFSGVHQPSISQFLSGKVDLSDDQLDRLLSCMGYRVEVSRSAVAVKLTRAERRSWMLHRQLASHLTPLTLEQWSATIEENLRRLRLGVTGQPHTDNIERWAELVENRDVGGLRRVLTGLGREQIEMREVSPMGGLLSEQERTDVLRRLVP
ncbi:helix-turn-helix domain-containing protein [Mycobacterium intracellulare]|uniref:helix-turn-helix domain-containing protein n=1 Tax=Mycobacterium intracellulare TaxID=1767 RepID=UPI001EEE3753|nr:helix-turn-helix transcriptional regulator [Mycobacterium intracellulare]MEE3752605.1 helix-turn-helix transcriptional regulator [Mycobacterium intracellulare]